MNITDVTFEPPLYKDKTFPVIFHADYMNARRRAVHANWHAGVEVLYCYGGKGNLLHGPNAAQFQAGDVVVINSYTLHTMHLQSKSCEYYCIIVDLPFLLGSGIPADRIQFPPVISGGEALRRCQKIVRILEEKNVYYQSEALAQILMLFVELSRNYAQEPATLTQNCAKSGQVLIIRALEYIRRYLNEPIQIEDVSRHIGVSKYYFCKLFSTYTGMSVLQYINMLKCDLARKCLREDGMTVSEVAHMLGFQNMSYFSRMYKKHIGVLPSLEKKNWRRG